VQALLGLIHGLDYLFVHVLIGSMGFYAFVLPARANAKQLLPNFAVRTRAVLCCAVLISTLWLVASSADMAESWSPANIWMAMMKTDFGHIWCIRIVALVILAILWRKTFLLSRGVEALFAILALLLLSSSYTGHLSPPSINLPFMFIVDWLHSLAVAVWTGGLLGLYLWLGNRLKAREFEREMSHSVVERFSHFAMVSTSVLAFTGVVMAYQLGVPLFWPWSTDYGKVLSLKIALFACALAAAAINQFLHLRGWKEGQEERFTKALRREVRLEFSIVVIVFMIAGFLTRLMP
jgi:putative copper resistance protein D